MGNIQLTRQRVDEKDEISTSAAHARSASIIAEDAAQAARVAADNVRTVAQTIIDKVGDDPETQRRALLQSKAFSDARQAAAFKQRIAEQARVEQQQAAATSAAVLRLQGRETDENQYSCPDFKPCTGDAAYNNSRAAGIGHDYNRRYARDRGDYFMRGNKITDGGINACVIEGTFLDRVTREYKDERRKFQYNCDVNKGWELASVDDIEGMLGSSAY